MIFDVLPNILLQLIFYDKDDEFPARATLLPDANATKLIDFEALGSFGNDICSIFDRN